MFKTLNMSGKTPSSRTPSSYKHKQTVTATPSTSKAHLEFDYHSPTKRVRDNYTVKNIEDEEFPEGYTFMDTINTPRSTGAWKTMDVQKCDLEKKSSKNNYDEQSSLSYVAEYDDIIKTFEDYLDDDLTEEFLIFAEHQESCRVEWLKAVLECRRLQTELDKANHEIGDFSNKLNHARRLLDQEKKTRKIAEEDRSTLEQQMILARELLFNDKYHAQIPNDTKEKLAFLNNTTVRSRNSVDRNTLGAAGRLNTINEVNSQELNSTGSLLSDFSYSRSEDDLDVSTKLQRKTWKAFQAAQNEEVVPKTRKTSSHKIVEINPTDTIVATTTLSVSKDGPITATSIIEAVPQNDPSIPSSDPLLTRQTPSEPTSDVIERLWMKEKDLDRLKGRSSVKRTHAFVPKTMMRPDTCGPCNKRIRFGKIVLKCKDCKGICHTDCKDELPLPCIPLVNTPTHKGVIGTIADYAPTLPPMVPALIVHCINEIELRGLNEVGIYRVPGSEKEVRGLKEKFLKCKSAPVLNEIDVHVICGVVKDFLRSLQESLITNALWNEFIQAAHATDELDIKPRLLQAIAKLPQPNRDTLAYVMLHLLKVAETKDCKMPIGNLSKIFGPTLIGYSSQEPDPQTMFMETHQQALVMEQLMRIPKDFWYPYVNMDSKITTPRSKVLLQTPSTISLARSTSRGFFTPYGSKSVQTRKKRRFFATPPKK